MDFDSTRYFFTKDKKHWNYCLKNAPECVFKGYPKANEIDWKHEVFVLAPTGWSGERFITYRKKRTHEVILVCIPAIPEDTANEPEGDTMRKTENNNEIIEITTAEDYKKWIDEFSKEGGIYCCKAIPDANDIDFIDPVVISCCGLKAVSIGYTKKTGGRFYVTNQERPVVCDFM